jgi:hypothetical protein
MRVEAILSLGFLLSGLAVPLAARTDVLAPETVAFKPRKLELGLAADARSLFLVGGHAFGRFIVVAGLDRTPYDLPNGLAVEFQPLIQVGQGQFDALGRGSLPISLASAGGAGDMVWLQAAGWRADDDSFLPSMMSPALGVALVAPAGSADGDVDVDRPGDAIKLRVVDGSQGFATRVELISTDSIPPNWTVSIKMTAPTGGHRLTIESVALGGTNAYVTAIIETPAPGEVTTDALEELAASADLGPSLECVEVRIHEHQRPADKDVPAVPPTSDSAR